MYCKVSIIFANISLVYILSSLLYLIYVKFANVGTPFMVNLKKNNNNWIENLEKIYNNSKNERKKIFFISLIISIIIILIFNPFHKIDAKTEKMIKDIQNIQVQ